MTFWDIQSKMITVPVTDEMKEVAIISAENRAQNIVRRFQMGKLSKAETNYSGCLGELAVKQYYGFPLTLDTVIANGKPDNGDIVLNGKIYDVKTQNMSEMSYDKLVAETLLDTDYKGTFRFTEKHIHHLQSKYDGGVIWVACNNNKNNYQRDLEPSSKLEIRQEIIDNIDEMLIVGISTQQSFVNRKLYISHDIAGDRMACPNYLFHHSELVPIPEKKLDFDTKKVVT